MKLEQPINEVDKIDSFKRFGRVKRVVGLMIESQGPESSIGDVCIIHIGKGRTRRIQAEVVGFKNENVILMPLQMYRIFHQALLSRQHLDLLR